MRLEEILKQYGVELLDFFNGEFDPRVYVSKYFITNNADIINFVVWKIINYDVSCNLIIPSYQNARSAYIIFENVEDGKKYDDWQADYLQKYFPNGQDRNALPSLSAGEGQFGYILHDADLKPDVDLVAHQLISTNALPRTECLTKWIWIVKNIPDRVYIISDNWVFANKDDMLKFKLSCMGDRKYVS